jgi:hypothetical protein
LLAARLRVHDLHHSTHVLSSYHLSRMKPNEERFIHGAKPCGYNVVDLSRVGADAPFSMGIVKEDWGWVKSHQGQPQGSQRLTLGAQSLAQHACVQVAANR